MIDGLNKPLTLALYGCAGAAAAYVPGEAVHAAFSTPSSLIDVLLNSAVWIGILGIGCGTALVMGQNRYLRRPWLDGREATISIGGGFGSGFISGAAAQFFYSLAQRFSGGSPLLVEGSRVLAWGMFGSLVGLGMSLFIPNLGRVRGLTGGSASGAVGGVGFILGGLLGGDLLGRLLGMTVVGFVLGYAIGLVEEATRTFWLQVSYGSSGERLRVSLGPEVVCVGGNSQRCAIWVQGARGIAARFRLTDGQVIFDDMTTEHTMVVEPGFQQQIGNVHLTVCGGLASLNPAARSVAAAKPIVAVPPPPPPPPTIIDSSRPKQASEVRSLASQPGPPVGAATRRRDTLPPPPPPPPRR